MNVYATGVPRGEEVEQKKYLKIYNDHDFSKFIKKYNINLQAQDVQQTPSSRNMKKTTTKYTMSI